MGWRKLQLFFFRLNLPCSAEVQHNADWVYIVSKSICVHTDLLQHSVFEHRAGLSACGVAGLREGAFREGSVTAVSPLFWNNGWSSQLSLSHTATGLLHSTYALCFLLCGGALGAGEPSGMLEMCQSIKLFSTHYNET